MFKFLFGRKEAEVKIETQRETAERCLQELNDVLATLDPKPAIKLEMATGQIEVEWPEQMPDEALALPAPDTKDESAKDAVDKVEAVAKDVQDALQQKDGAAKSAA